MTTEQCSVIHQLTSYQVWTAASEKLIFVHLSWVINLHLSYLIHCPSSSSRYTLRLPQLVDWIPSRSNVGQHQLSLSLSKWARSKFSDRIRSKFSDWSKLCSLIESTRGCSQPFSVSCARKTSWVKYGTYNGCLDQICSFENINDFFW